MSTEETEVPVLELIEIPNRSFAPDNRPVRLFHPRWMYCRVHNHSEEPIFIYGPRHPSEMTTEPSSIFILPPTQSTPKRWDCKGILIPSDSVAIIGASIINGPVALKYRDMRRVTIEMDGCRYRCPRSNGVLALAQMDFKIPELPYLELLRLPRRLVDLIPTSR